MAISIHENPVNHLMKSGGIYFAKCFIGKSRFNEMVKKKARPQTAPTGSNSRKQFPV